MLFFVLLNNNIFYKKIDLLSLALGLVGSGDNALRPRPQYILFTVQRYVSHVTLEKEKNIKKANHIPYFSLKSPSFSLIPPNY